MKKRITGYRKKMDDFLANYGKTPDVDDRERLDRIIEEHLRQIAFFQHERLIHLIVTVTFALLTFMSVAVGIIACYPYIYALTALLLILLVPYVMHYYTLENETQKMYGQYDCLIALRDAIR